MTRKSRRRAGQAAREVPKLEPGPAQDVVEDEVEEEEPVSPVPGMRQPGGRQDEGHPGSQEGDEDDAGSGDNAAEEEDEEAEEEEDEEEEDGEAEEAEDEDEVAVPAGSGSGFAARRAAQSGAAAAVAGKAGRGAGRSDSRSLYTELERLLKEQEQLSEDLRSVMCSRTEEARRAEAAEAVEKIHRQKIGELELHVAQLELRLQTAADEEATWHELIHSFETQQAEDMAALEQQRLAKEEEVKTLKAELESRRRAKLEKNREEERKRRMAADERCMRLQAALDFVTGRLDVSEEQLRYLLGDEGCVNSAAPISRWFLGSDEAERLLQQQKQNHREEMRGLVALCNQELRRRSKSFASLLEEEGLPRLLSALSAEGVVDIQSSTGALQKHDPDRAARLREAVLGQA